MSGLDPFEAQQEMGRVLGLVLRSLVFGEMRPAGLPLAVGLVASFAIVSGSLMVWLPEVLDWAYLIAGLEVSALRWATLAPFVGIGLVLWYGIARLGRLALSAFSSRKPS
jgi:hypothetical protein